MSSPINEQEIKYLKELNPQGVCVFYTNKRAVFRYSCRALAVPNIVATRNAGYSVQHKQGKTSLNWYSEVQL